MKIPFLGRLFEKRSEEQPEKWWKIFTGNRSVAGISVTENSAMRVATVYACIRVLSWSLASLPLITYKRLERGKERAITLPIYNLLHISPNPFQTSFIFRSTQMARACGWGNAYAEIEFANGGPVALWPIPPWHVTPKLNAQHELYYTVRTATGDIDLPYYRMLHIQGLGTDGLKGLSPIQMAKESIGLSLAAEEFGARFLGEGANSGLVVNVPSGLSDTAFERLKTSFKESYSGLSKAHRVMFLEENMKVEKTTIPPDQAQFLETRKFQVREIARIFNVPPHMIGDLEQATFSNIEHQAIEFVVHTMRPWFVNWEQELSRKLLIGAANQNYFVEFLIDGLLRGDSISRSQFYNQMFMIGAFSPNDIREKENLNPIDGGDEYYIPLNMQPASWGSQPPATIGVASLKLLEDRKRSKGSAIIRYRIAKSFRPVFEDAGQRIVDREAQNIRRAVKKYLSERSLNGFMAWLDDFYRDFTKYIHKQIAPAANALNDAIRPAIADQIGQITETDKQIGEYVNAFGVRYTTSSSGQMKALLKEAEAEDIVDLHQAAESIEGRLTEWEEKRPSKIGMNETVQLANFITKTLFAGAGITKLIWTNTGAKPCPYCEEMDGRVVGIEKDFLGNDDKLNAEGEDKPMTIYRPTSQPPLHEGCECQIEPG